MSWKFLSNTKKKIVPKIWKKFYFVAKLPVYSEKNSKIWKEQELKISKKVKKV